MPPEAWGQPDLETSKKMGALSKRRVAVGNGSLGQGERKREEEVSGARRIAPWRHRVAVSHDSGSLGKGAAGVATRIVS
jgi:hypothetical protein